MLSSRLEIRKFSSGDSEDVYEYLSDEEVIKYEPYSVQTLDESKKSLERMMHSDDFWAICLRETGRVIGQVYLARQSQDNWELGYVFNRTFQKHGYASEAATALIEDAFMNQGAHRISAMCNPENDSSWKLLERVGFRKEGHLLKNVYFNKTTDGEPIWQDTYLYGMLQDDFIQKTHENDR